MYKFFCIIIVAMLCLLPCFTGCEDDGTYNETSPETSPTLVWKYGGVNGSGAVEDPGVQISNLKFGGKSGLSYSWKTPTGMKPWGESSKNALAGLACAFYYDEASKTWIGGKFDHISTSRTTRDFININSGYCGWEPNKFFAAKKHGFCILSYSGKWRTNLITD